MVNTDYDDWLQERATVSLTNAQWCKLQHFIKLAQKVLTEKSTMTKCYPFPSHTPEFWEEFTPLITAVDKAISDR